MQFGGTLGKGMDINRFLTKGQNSVKILQTSEVKTTFIMILASSVHIRKKSTIVVLMYHSLDTRKARHHSQYNFFQYLSHIHTVAVSRHRLGPTQLFPFKVIQIKPSLLGQPSIWLGFGATAGLDLEQLLLSL